MRCRQEGREERERREKEREKKKEEKKEENERALSLAHKSTTFFETLAESTAQRWGTSSLQVTKRAVVWDDT